MDYIIRLSSDTINIPVKVDAKECLLEIFDGDKKIFEFMVPSSECSDDSEVYEFDYIAKIEAKDYNGHELTLRGEFCHLFFELIGHDGFEEVLTEARPRIHFTADYGWINDPNGLIYDGNRYHLYFQYNPLNIKWENMSWGHASSTDLLDWTQHKTVMYPDENGTMFSGCGLIKDDKMYFPYTVAGGSSNWSVGKPFYQGLAISEDGGETLIKQDEPLLTDTGKDSRDPKIFWHDETKAYIMVLYLENNDFGVFRSTDFKNWGKSQHLTLDKAWECPDLLKVACDDGSYKWMFWSADGFYYWGDFDGYKFTSDFKRHLAYFNKSPYATQTYWGIKDRIVAQPWLRFDERNGKNYQGAMAVPKEYSAKRLEDDYILIQRHVRELYDRLVECDEVPRTSPYLVRIDGPLPDFIELEINGNAITIDSKNSILRIFGENVDVPISMESIELLVDHNILEISFSDACIGAYCIPENGNDFKISWRNNGDIKGCSSKDRTDCHYSIKSFK